MSSNRFTAKYPPIRYDPAGAFISPHGLSRDDQVALRPRLEAARQALLTDNRPPVAAFSDLPERLLSEYARLRTKSELGRILATARRLRDSVDRVIVLGSGTAQAGPKALFAACCHPYHNELGRGDRGGRPRIYFDGNHADNDATQALLDLVRQNREAQTIDDRWAIIVSSSHGDTLETSVALRHLLDPLRQACGDDDQTLARLIVPITGSHGRLFDQSRAIGCPEVFSWPDGVAESFTLFSPVGLLPASVMGLDIVRLLKGAAEMTERFRTAPPGDNPVLDYAAVTHLMKTLRGVTIRVLSLWNTALEAFGQWHDRLPTNGLNLHGLGSQHQEDRRDQFITHVVIDSVRRDRLSTEPSPLDQDNLNESADTTMPDMLSAAIRSARQSTTAADRPTTDLHLPALDESALGQLFQMLMLATVLESQLG